METDKSVGRVVGGLLLVQMLLLMVGFIVLKAGVVTDYLPVAAGAEGGMRAGVLLLLGGAVVALVISAVAYPVIREYGMRLAVGMVAVATVWVVMQLIDGVHIHTMLGLSQRYSADPGANVDLYNLIARQVRHTRSAAHYAVLLAIDVWFAIFYAVLFRFRLVPRILAAIGLVAIAVHIIGIPMSMFIGYAVVMPVGYGIAISYLLIGGWLVVKGFPEKGLERGLNG